MKQELPPLTSYSEQQRQKAMNKYSLIAAYLNHEKNLRTITEESGISKRTLLYWISKYKQFGLVGLIRKSRTDSGVFKVEKEVQEAIKNLILSHKRNSVTSIHRKICEICKKKELETTQLLSGVYYFKVFIIRTKKISL